MIAGSWDTGQYAITAFQPRLGPSLYERFLETYRRRLLPRLVDERPYFFTFRRVLLHAAR